jgi:hypothetical protein
MREFNAIFAVTKTSHDPSEKEEELDLIVKEEETAASIQSFTKKTSPKNIDDPVTGLKTIDTSA